jgi:hypothetical protein
MVQLDRSVPGLPHVEGALLLGFCEDRSLLRISSPYHMLLALAQLLFLAQFSWALLV